MKRVNPKAALVIIALAVGLGQPHARRADSATPLPAEAAEAAREFLFAFSRNDRDAIKNMLPRRLENLYGPCPFAGMPALTKPRADTETGAIDFQGTMRDPDLPKKGSIVLRYVEENGVRAWRVRQLYWYDELPREANLPERSPTAADRQEEPKLREAAAKFLEAWLAQHYQQMDGLTFHWWEVSRRPPGWVRMTGADLTARETALNGLRVEFVAKLKVGRVLPKSVGGNLWLVQEDGQWRVRPLTFTFIF